MISEIDFFYLFFLANMSTLINWAKERGKWDFFSKSKMLVLIGCLEDSTNEVKLNELTTIMFKSVGSVRFV